MPLRPPPMQSATPGQPIAACTCSPVATQHLATATTQRTLTVPTVEQPIRVLA